MKAGRSQNRLIADFLMPSWSTTKPVFFIVDLTYKNSTYCAKNCTATLKIFMRVVYYMIKYSSKRRVLKWPGGQLVVETS